MTATVSRGGQWREVPRREVVPGDVIRLSAGDLVPADARLLTARDLHVQQASLTGESLPAEKEVAGSPPDAPLKTGDRDAVFFGTAVVSGTATALVAATRPATAFGEIAARLAARPPETEFDRGTRHSGVFITQTVLVLVFFVTGWFVESLATQTLVLFVIRTGGNPFRSRPNRPLAAAVLAAVRVGVCCRTRRWPAHSGSSRCPRDASCLSPRQPPPTSRLCKL